MAFPLMVMDGGEDAWAPSITKQVGANLGYIEVGGDFNALGYVLQAEKYAAENTWFIVNFNWPSPEYYPPAVNYWKTWPNCWGYALPDELDRKEWASPALALAIHNAIKSADNTRPTLQTNGFGNYSRGYWYDYIGTTNLILFDYYWRQCTSDGQVHGSVAATKSFMDTAHSTYAAKGLSTGTYQMGMFMQAFVEHNCAAGTPTLSEWDQIADYALTTLGGSRWGMFAIYAAFVRDANRSHLEARNAHGEALRSIASSFCGARSGAGGASYAVSTLTSVTPPARPTYPPPSNTERPGGGSGSTQNQLGVPPKISMPTKSVYAVAPSGTGPYSPVLSGAPTGTTMSGLNIYAGATPGVCTLTVTDSSAPVKTSVSKVSVYTPLCQEI